MLNRKILRNIEALFIIQSEHKNDFILKVDSDSKGQCAYVIMRNGVVKCLNLENDDECNWDFINE